MHLSNPNEWIFTFELSCGHLVMTFIILERFPESRKNWSLQWPGSFEIAFFCYFPTFAHFSSKRVNFYRLAVLWSYGDDFHHFRRLSRKSKKLKFSTTLALLKNGQFCYLHNFAYFSSKSVIFYTLAVLWSTSDDFHHFQRLSRKTKKLKFLMTAELSKKPIIATLPILHISHPNAWIFTFDLSCGHLVMLFIILEGFPESRKKWSFQPPRPCRKMVNFAVFTF